MAQLTIPAADFNLNTTWTCHVVYTYNSTGAFNSAYSTTEDYEVADNVVSFTDSRLVGATINSVTVHASHGTGTLGGSFTIDGVSPDSADLVTLTNPDFSDDTINVTFAWNATTDDPNSHILSTAPTYNGQSSQSFDTGHKSSSLVEKVYIIVDYEPSYTPPTLIDYTDPEPVAGETYVKAIHTNQIRSNVNLVRIARNLAIYSFTPITAGETSLAGWNNHVLELRAAIDEMGIPHEDWIELGENYPRLDVLMQLRRVVEEVAAGYSNFPSGYKRLSYIQFSGSQYIDTGIKATQDTVIEGTCTQEGTVSAYIFGVASTSNKASITGYYSSTAKGTWRFGTVYTYPTLPKDTKFTFVMNKSGVTLDGSANDYNGTVGTFTTPYTIMLGSGHLADGTISPSCHVGKFYSFKMWNDSSLVAEFVPCINPNGVYGFWNTISQTFHPSEGSSAFTGG